MSITGPPPKFHGARDILLNYTKGYIGLARHGVSDNFIGFHPRKGSWVLTDFRIAQSPDLLSRLDEAKLDVAMGYRERRLHVRLTGEDLQRNRDLLAELIATAADVLPPVEN